jgi:hypothetical protein
MSNGMNHIAVAVFSNSHECGIASGPLRIMTIPKSVLMNARTADARISSMAQ